MIDAGTLLAEVRQSAELSLRELAKLAGVSFTTIRRIETGEMDPTVGMLRRVLSAAGAELEMTAKPAARRRASLAALADKYDENVSGERPTGQRSERSSTTSACIPMRLQARSPLSHTRPHG